MAANNKFKAYFSNIHFVGKNVNTQDALYNAVKAKSSFWWYGFY